VGRAKALCGAGALAFHLGAFEMSRQRLEQSVRVARELGDDALVAVALIHFAWPLTRQDLALARKVTEEGLALLRAAGDSWGVATALNYLGELMRMLGNLSEAVALYEQSVALNREIGNTWVLATSTHNLACTLRRLGDVDRVPALNRETAMAVRQIRSPTLATMVLQDMADTAMQQGDPARATRLVGAATAIYDAIGCVIEGADQIEFDRVTKSARELLSPDAYTRAWTEGTSMTREEAIAFALDEDDGCVRALRTGGSGV
jgi:tetratricopeptide (TPR) repeat protein